MAKEIFTSEEAFPLMEEFTKNVFKVVFPYSNFHSGYYAGSLVGKLTKENLFKSTPYEIEINNSFIHYASLQSLISILKNGFFRISEFRHFDDMQELNYAAGVLTIVIFSKLMKIS